MAAEYVSQAITTTIRATSRASVKIRDSYYTLEYTEERVIPDRFDNNDIDLSAEKALLWQEVNAQVDQQIQETYDAIMQKRQLTFN